MFKLNNSTNKSTHDKKDNIQYQRFGKKIETESDNYEDYYLYKLLDLPEALKEMLISKKISMTKLRNMTSSQLTDILGIDSYIAGLIVIAVRKL